jgi:hypothetical protein
MMDKETLKLKVSSYTVPMLQYAIADCHDTLKVGQYTYEHPYARKLWAEIDVCRDRLMALKKGSEK